MSYAKWFAIGWAAGSCVYWLRWHAQLDAEYKELCHVSKGNPT